MLSTSSICVHLSPLLAIRSIGFIFTKNSVPLRLVYVIFPHSLCPPSGELPLDGIFQGLQLRIPQANALIVRLLVQRAAL